MARILLALPLVLAIAELALLIELGDHIGTLPVVMLVLAGLFGGALLMKRGSIGTLRRAQEVMRRGESPGVELFEGAAFIVAALLFIFPGVLTDLAALLLLVPGVRGFIRRRLAKLFRVETRASAAVIEGEWREIPDDKPRLR